MTIKKNKGKIGYFLLIYFILWILLFEFILPVNNILPKPSILFEYFPDFLKAYNFFGNYFFTISVIYLSLIAAYFLINFLNIFLLKRNTFFSDFFLSLEWFSKYIPGVIIGLFLILWFPESEFAEFVFVFLTAFFSINIWLQNEVGNVKQEYIDSALSLGASQNLVTKKIIWKSIQPSLFNHLLNLHFYIWVILLAFEFMKADFGLGSLYKAGLEFHDLSGIFTVSVLTGVTIYLGSLLIKFLINKFFFWS